MVNRIAQDRLQPAKPEERNFDRDGRNTDQRKDILVGLRAEPTTREKIARTTLKQRTRTPTDSRLHFLVVGSCWGKRDNSIKQRRDDQALEDHHFEFQVYPLAPEITPQLEVFIHFADDRFALRCEQVLNIELGGRGTWSH